MVVGLLEMCAPASAFLHYLPYGWVRNIRNRGVKGYAKMSKSVWKRVAIAVATMVSMVGLALVAVAPMSGAGANDRGMCVDNDGDGWGWDGVGSCRIRNTVASTSDSYGGGPGGNRYKNYRVPCIDSDNDGWGWAEVTVTGRSNGQVQRHGVSCTGGQVSFKIRQSSGRLISVSGAA